MGKQKSFAVIGLGRFGRSIATQLFNLGSEVLAIDKNPANVQLISDNVTEAIICDAKDENTLSEISISDYDCVIVATGSEFNDSVLITLLLKEMGVPYIICKAQNENHKKVLLKIGADSVIIPEQEMGIKYANTLVSKHIMDIIELSEEYSIAEFAPPSSWIGKSLIDLDLRKKKKINIVAVKKDDGTFNIAPAPDYIFSSGDIAIIIGPDGIIEQIN